MIEMLVAFVVFCVVVGIVFLGAKWICAQAAVPEPIAKGVLWVLGAVALIVLLVRFIAPLVRNVPALR